MSNGIPGNPAPGTHHNTPRLPNEPKFPQGRQPKASYNSRSVERWKPSPSVINPPPEQIPKSTANTGQGDDSHAKNSQPQQGPLSTLTELVHKMTHHTNKYWSKQEGEPAKQNKPLVERKISGDSGSAPMDIRSLQPVVDMLRPAIQSLKQLPPHSKEAEKIEHLMNLPMLGIPFKDWDNLTKIEAHCATPDVNIANGYKAERENYISRRFNTRLKTFSKDIQAFNEEFLNNYVNDTFSSHSDEYKIVMRGGNEERAKFLSQHGEDLMEAFCRQYEKRFNGTCTSEILGFLRNHKTGFLTLLPEAILKKYDLPFHTNPPAKIFEKDIRSALSEDFEKIRADFQTQPDLKPAEIGVSKRKYGSILMQRLNAMRAILMTESS